MTGHITEQCRNKWLDNENFQPAGDQGEVKENRIPLKMHFYRNCINFCVLGPIVLFSSFFPPFFLSLQRIVSQLATVIYRSVFLPV